MQITGSDYTYDNINAWSELFVSSAALIGAWIGVEYKFGEEASAKK